MGRRQMAFIVATDNKIKDKNIDNLNDLLTNGWHVVSTCPMPNDSYIGYALVILEKD